MRTLKSVVVFLMLLVTGSAMTLSAQNRTISGKVFDANDEPLIGVTIAVPEGEVVLNVSYIGFASQKVTVAPSQSSVTVHMKEDAIMLNETVVVGYGKQKKVNLTGAVATVGGDELENRVTSSLSNMLQGTVAGLNVTTSSGVPGSSATINVRGVTSINDAEPLVLIDGAVGELDRINPNDVESISVIKDASAAAIYGARAAFGVILVTTKSGAAKDGKATVHYSWTV